MEEDALESIHNVSVVARFSVEKLSLWRPRPMSALVSSTLQRNLHDNMQKEQDFWECLQFRSYLLRFFLEIVFWTHSNFDNNLENGWRIDASVPINIAPSNLYLNTYYAPKVSPKLSGCKTRIFVFLIIITFSAISRLDHN